MSLDPTPSRVAKRGPDPARYVKIMPYDSGVYVKLALFSVALFVAPITAYYLAKDRWLAGVYTSLTIGNTVYAGGIAALVANLVLGGYILTACLEDDGSQALPKETKKTQ
ncbi:hypothetical protein MEQU1_002463 [Malassezia equina]|uniref:Vacuolar ATPase assembly integral membrane protein VMA21 n=1 Tax=Malassezia equina TaxID=1381935 RepID=A0AAF0IZ99_9BASI|nr:hypothetical protein MEQU1_002463 [Malassezia equina]